MQDSFRGTAKGSLEIWLSLKLAVAAPNSTTKGEKRRPVGNLVPWGCNPPLISGDPIRISIAEGRVYGL
ncbi:hypothetical protein GQ55_3G453600 [Panicum hallii var. hallii]|uniref:Uncharacterized protein n=1 Tax=Panicum hallii var. hallii TaxID=1504633 RepID=A0A2T7EIL4_9POAL|nr:hypothetical protein GQ55_3G453600 [Panicum hallii var. hallii]